MITFSASPSDKLRAHSLMSQPLLSVQREVCLCKGSHHWLTCLSAHLVRRCACRQPSGMCTSVRVGLLGLTEHTVKAVAPLLRNQMAACCTAYLRITL